MKLNYIMFDVTDNCNFRCKHCYKEQPENYVDLQAETIIEFLKEVDNNGFKPSIVISGGEPLLYKDLFKVLDYICDGRSVRVNTNGLLLDKYYKELSKYDNLKLQVSLDGYNDETFFSVRNNHSFNKIIANAKIAYKYGLDLYLRATLTKSTLLTYEKFIELSKEIEIPIVIRPMYNTGEKTQEDLIIRFEELCAWQEDVIEKDLLLYTGGKNLISEHSCHLLKKDIVYSILTIDNMGNVYPCSILRSEKFYMGSIYKDSFLTIFNNNDLIQTELLNIINSESCQECGFRKRFGDGTCVSSCYLGNKKCVIKKIYGE